jgi:hypothetical protein
MSSLSSFTVAKAPRRRPKFSSNKAGEALQMGFVYFARLFHGIPAFAGMTGKNVAHIGFAAP